MQKIHVLLEVDADEPFVDDLRRAQESGKPQIIRLSRHPKVISVEAVDVDVNEEKRK